MSIDREFLVELRNVLEPAAQMAASGDVGAMWFKGVGTVVRLLDEKIEETKPPVCGTCGHAESDHNDETGYCYECLECDGFTEE